jgi:large subunit ribosomal protein L13e
MGFSSMLPNVHLNKDWQEKVKTFFNQPGKKLRRRKIRV